MKRNATLTVHCLALMVAPLLLGACAPAAPPAPAPTLAPVSQAATQAPAPTQPPAPTQAPAPTQPPAPTQAAAPTQPPAPAPTKAPAATATQPPKEHKPGTLLLATTTSTADSGLLDYILPMFEKQFNAKVDVVAVGSGQAIEIGRRCDADVLLVHSRKAEDQFVSDGFAKKRFDVMYNDFIIVGPTADPAKIAALPNAKAAFKAVANTSAPFASRGDKSGTNTKELGIWSSVGITPTKDMKWYNALGQGMGETLLFSNEQKAYTLSDRGTYLSMVDKLKDLPILFGGKNLAENKDKDLLNPYGVIPIDPAKCPSVNTDLAGKFTDWLLSVDTQKTIGGYGLDKFGQSLFYPSSDAYKASK